MKDTYRPDDHSREPYLPAPAEAAPIAPSYTPDSPIIPYEDDDTIALFAPDPPGSSPILPEETYELPEPRQPADAELTIMPEASVATPRESDTPALQRETVDRSGTVYEKLDNEPRITILADRDAADVAVAGLVGARAARLEQDDKPSAIMIVNFDSDPNTAVLDTREYNTIEISPTDEDGMWSKLDTEDRADIIASAATENPDDARAASAALYKVGKALEEPILDKNGKVVDTKLPSLTELKDGIAMVTDGRIGDGKNDAPSLSTDRAEDAQGALNKLKRDIDARSISGTGNFLEVITRKTPEQPRASNVGTNVTVINFQLEASSELARRDERNLLVNATPTYLRKTPHGRPEYVVLRNADTADPDAMKRVLDELSRQRIPHLITGEDVAVLQALTKGSSAYVVGNTDYLRANMAALVFGSENRGRITSAGISMSTSSGNSFDVGVNQSTQPGREWSAGNGVSASAGGSFGSSLDHSQSIAYGDVPNITAADIQANGQYDAIIKGSHANDPPLRYDLRTGQEITDVPFDKDREPEPLVVENTADEQPALPSASSAQPELAEPPKLPTPRRNQIPTANSAPQRGIQLERTYTDLTGKKARWPGIRPGGRGGRPKDDFKKWCYDAWKQGVDRGVFNMTWEEWTKNMNEEDVR